VSSFSVRCNKTDLAFTKGFMLSVRQISRDVTTFQFGFPFREVNFDGFIMRNRYAIGSVAEDTKGAEGVRFELTRPFGLPVFKTGAINRSATPPKEV
jgi:hypothetical protein